MHRMRLKQPMQPILPDMHRMHFMRLMQDTVLFNDTILMNIRCVRMGLF